MTNLSVNTAIAGHESVQLQLSDHVVQNRQTGQQMTYWDMFNKATKFEFSLHKIERICTDIDYIIQLHQQDQDLVPPGSVTNRTLNSFNNWKKLYSSQKEGEKLRKELDVPNLEKGGNEQNIICK